MIWALLYLCVGALNALHSWGGICSRRREEYGNSAVLLSIFIASGMLFWPASVVIKFVIGASEENEQ